jgi:hypothetical protein
MPTHSSPDALRRHRTTSGRQGPGGQRRQGQHQTSSLEFAWTPWEAEILREAFARAFGAFASASSPVAWGLDIPDLPRSVTRYGGGADVVPGD